MGSVASADVYRLAEALKQSAGNSEVTTQNVLVHSAQFIKAEMEARVPVDTGRLKQSIQIWVSTHEVKIGPDTEYAAFVEFGTKPHVIEPKNKKALAFSVGGTKYIVKKVNHPGTRAQPYVRPAFEAWVDSLGSLVAEAHVKRIEEAYR